MHMRKYRSQGRASDLRLTEGLFLEQLDQRGAEFGPLQWGTVGSRSVHLGLSW
jgi:hypothetical protein